MGKAVGIPGTKDKTSTQLEGVSYVKGIFAHLMLAMPTRLGALSRGEIIGAEQMKDIRLSQAGRLVDQTALVDQQGKADLRLLAELPGVFGPAQSYGDYVGTFIFELGFRVAQLRNMLAAEDSTPMAEKDNHRRTLRPQRTQSHGISINIGESQRSERGGKRGHEQRL